MLSESTVVVLKDKKEVEYKVADLYEYFLLELKAGRKCSVHIKAYDPLKRKFEFKPITNFKPIPVHNAIKQVVLSFPEKNLTATVILDLNTRVMVKNSNRETSVNVGFINHVGEKPLMGYVEADKLEYKKILKVEDYNGTGLIKSFVNTTKVEAPAKKRGRKPKNPKDVEVVEVKNNVELKVFSIELADGSLILCDNLLQR